MNLTPGPEKEKPEDKPEKPTELKKRKPLEWPVVRKNHSKDNESKAWTEAMREPSREHLPSGEPELKAVESLISAFEQQYPLAELNAVKELSKQDGYAHPLRDPAKRALGPIRDLIYVLIEETNVPKETYFMLEAKYKMLAQAVGVISHGVVDHTR